MGSAAAPDLPATPDMTDRATRGYALESRVSLCAGATLGSGLAHGMKHHELLSQLFCENR